MLMALVGAMPGRASWPGWLGCAAVLSSGADTLAGGGSGGVARAAGTRFARCGSCPWLWKSLVALVAGAASAL